MVRKAKNSYYQALGKKSLSTLLLKMRFLKRVLGREVTQSELRETILGAGRIIMKETTRVFTEEQQTQQGCAKGNEIKAVVSEILKR